MSDDTRRRVDPRAGRRPPGRDRIRRDPRTERTAAPPIEAKDRPPRPRRDPRAASDGGDVATASGRPRRDPRAEGDAATETAARPRRDPRAERGRDRLTRAAALAHGAATAPAAAPETRSAPVVTVGDGGPWVLAVVDAPGGRLEHTDRAVVGFARGLADEIGVVALAPTPVEAGAAGADRIVAVGAAPPDLAAAAIADLVERLAAPHLVFAETAAGGDLARRVAARLGVRAATRVVGRDGDDIVRLGDGGRSEVTMAPPRVVAVEADAVDAYAGPAREGRVMAVAMTDAAAAGPPNLEMGALAPPDPDSGPLAEAALIVSAGDGVTDFVAFDSVARALGAVKGASRALCDRGVVARDRQVGASGTLVEPRCYMAFGISGAAQHLQGIQRCQRVVAVNTDLHAEMVKRADLAIIADAQEVMPALARLAAEEGSGDDG